MPSSRPIAVILPAMLFAVLLLCSVSLAAPITVQLRVEGSTQTLYEGPVSSEAVESPPGLETPESEGPHACDVKDNGSNGGFGSPAATPTTALHAGAVASGLAFGASWSSSLNDFNIARVGGDIANAAGNGEYWGYAVNYTTANVGGCQFQLAPGSEVVWAYNYFSLPHLLDLSGASSANVGSPITVHVSDGQTGAALAGAVIGEDIGGSTTPLPGNPTTDSSGNATVTLARAGTVKLKATRPESVRSNGLAVCVHNGADGTCGTSAGGGQSVPTAKAMPTSSPPPGAEVATVEGIVSGHVYGHRHAPRVLRGSVSVPAGGTLKQVRISLQRHFKRRCWRFDGRRERFVRARCGSASFFSVGASESFSYLLPAALPPGRYTYDIEALDNSGHLTKLLVGVSHVVFRVR